MGTFSSSRKQRYYLNIVFLNTKINASLSIIIKEKYVFTSSSRICMRMPTACILFLISAINNESAVMLLISLGKTLYIFKSIFHKIKINY